MSADSASLRWPTARSPGRPAGGPHQPNPAPGSVRSPSAGPGAPPAPPAPRKRSPLPRSAWRSAGSRRSLGCCRPRHTQGRAGWPGRTSYRLFKQPLIEEVACGIDMGLCGRRRSRRVGNLRQPVVAGYRFMNAITRAAMASGCSGSIACPSPGRSTTSTLLPAVRRKTCPLAGGARRSFKP